MTTKSQIRKKYLDKRSKLTIEEVEKESEIICDKFINDLLPKILDEFDDPIFAVYLSANNEVQTSKIIQHFERNKIRFCYPKIAQKTNQLNYVESSEYLQFKNNETYKNIKEPVSQNFITPNILIVPLVVFDKDKNRIGMGKGFFDQSISELKSQNVRICTIGLGFSMQYHKQKLEVEKHDQSLDYIVSSQSIFS